MGSHWQYLFLVIKQIQIRNRFKLLVRSYKGDVQYDCRSCYDTVRQFQVGIFFDFYCLILCGISDIDNYKVR